LYYRSKLIRRIRNRGSQWQCRILKHGVREIGNSSAKRRTAAINANHSKECLGDTTETLTSEETRLERGQKLPIHGMKWTYRDGEKVHVVAGGVALGPEEAEGGTDGHGNGVEDLGDDKAESDSVLIKVSKIPYP